MVDGPTRGNGPQGDTSLSGEPAPHGAAAPLPVGGRSKSGSRGAGNSATPTNEDGGRTSVIRNAYRRIGLSPYQWTLIILLALYLIAISPIPIFGGQGIAAGFRKTPRNMIGVSYGGGPIESAHYLRTVPPGSKLYWNGFFNKLYLYPADEQNYIISLNPRVGAVRGKDSIVAPTADRVALTYQVAVYFKLNTDLIRQFHEQLGLQYAAYTTKGWNALLQDTFRQNLENAIQEQTRTYTVAQLYGNTQNLIQFQNAVQADFGQRLVSALGASYFCSPSFKPKEPCGSPTFIVKQIDIPSTVANAFVNQRAAEIQVAQRQAEAEGIEELQKAGVNIDGATYPILKGVENGSITFWVVPSTSGLTLTTPGSGGSSSGGAPTATTTTTVATTSTP
jgi:hypothetical protein